MPYAVLLLLAITDENLKGFGVFHENGLMPRNKTIQSLFSFLVWLQQLLKKTAPDMSDGTLCGNQDAVDLIRMRALSRRHRVTNPLILQTLSLVRHHPALSLMMLQRD